MLCQANQRLLRATPSQWPLSFGVYYQSLKGALWCDHTSRKATQHHVVADFYFLFCLWPYLNTHIQQKMINPGQGINSWGKCTFLIFCIHLFFTRIPLNYKKSFLWKGDKKKRDLSLKHPLILGNYSLLRITAEIRGLFFIWIFQRNWFDLYFMWQQANIIKWMVFDLHIL